MPIDSYKEVVDRLERYCREVEKDYPGVWKQFLVYRQAIAMSAGVLSASSTGGSRRRRRCRGPATSGRFFFGHLANILAGKATEAIERHGHNQLKTFGVGKDRTPRRLARRPAAAPVRQGFSRATGRTATA